jgi:HJR/Mrr/RecB family endonuclease/TolA-binding protein
MNVPDRTLDRLKPWVTSLPESLEYSSFCIKLNTKRPLLLSIEPSNEPPPVDGTSNQRIIRPEHGLYLGRFLEDTFNELVATPTPFTLEEHDLLTHVFICGVTGTGKTVLGKAILEEAALTGVPAIAVDLKGDISALALMMTGDDPKEILPYVHREPDKTPDEIAVEIAGRHKSNLEKWGLTRDFILEAKGRIAVNVFTPRSNDGFRLSLSAFPEPPDNLSEIKEQNPDAYDSLLDFLAQQFVARLQLRKGLMEKARGYVFDILKTCFERDTPMLGYDGVKRVLDEFSSPELGIDQIGGLDTSAYISESDRKHLANAVNGLLTGARRRMYEGFPVDIEGLIHNQREVSKTPICVINVQHLEFQEQAYVVGYLAHLISFWMRKQPGTYRPRLIFYVDEIGGGGGKQAFFPSVAVSPCKPALNILLRQGRAYGVSCIFATQNPGDIDYKGLSNCDTWMVGRLRTDLDRRKIKQGAADAEIEFESASAYLPTLTAGQFLVKTSGTKWQIIQERWLLSLHRPLTGQELRQLKAAYEREAEHLLNEASERCNQGKLSDSAALLRKLITEYPYSSLIARAYLMLARSLIKSGKQSEAKAELQELLKRWPDDAEHAEAKLLLGSCHERDSELDKALETYREAQLLATDPDLKEQARNHAELCSARITWPTLRTGEKITWWILGKKPEDGDLVELQVKDDEILARTHHSRLSELDLSLPPPLEYHMLVKSGPPASSDLEDAKGLDWAEKQAFTLQGILSKGDLDSAEKLARKIIQRLNERRLPAVPAVLAALQSVEKAVNARRDTVRSNVLQIEAKQFEYDIARLMTKMGYKAHCTEATGDDGVDVFAIKNQQKVVIQCKRWRHRPVGRAVIDELGGTAHRHQATGAILATTSYFSESAIKAARELKIDLWDFDHLCHLFREYSLGRLKA